MTVKSFSQFISELSDNKESERQQALVRILLASVFTVFFFCVDRFNWFGGINVSVVYSAVAFLVVAVAIFVTMRINPRFKVAGRKAGMVLDLAFITFSLIVGGAVAAFGYGGYLWVTIANGLRFGNRYLKVAHVASLVCFASVLYVSEYWRQNVVLGAGLLLWLFLLPMYVSKLLHILENALHSANYANKAKSTFLANMSHEIRTPLTAIIGYAEVSLDGDQTEQERNSALKTIIRSGNHLLNVINDILDFSKIEADQIDIEFISVDLFQLVSDLDSLLRQQAQKKGLECKVLFEYPLPNRIGTDPLRLKQILINLCSNAIKFTDKGSVTMSIACDSSKQMMRFTVKDTGIGMTAEQVRKIFKPFKQADSSITRRFGGTGLGLSLSKRLAEKLGGSIEVESEHGRGTQFTLNIETGSLRNSEFVYSLGQIKHVVEPDQGLEEVTRLSGKVLLAEDNQANQNLLSLLLENMGATVTLAENGEEAIGLAYQEHFDLIYMDMQMPVLSGLDAVKILRKRGYERPIVALTANATNEDRMQCVEAGCSDFLTKPVAREKLYRTTARYLPSAGKSSLPTGPVISTLLEDDPSYLDLLEKFVATLPALITNLSHRYRSQDWQAFREDLHILKGTAGGYGYRILSDLAYKAEIQMSGENHEAAGEVLAEITQVCERIYDGILINKQRQTEESKVNQS